MLDEKEHLKLENRSNTPLKRLYDSWATTRFSIEFMNYVDDWFNHHKRLVLITTSEESFAVYCIVHVLWTLELTDDK